MHLACKFVDIGEYYDDDDNLFMLLLKCSARLGCMYAEVCTID